MNENNKYLVMLDNFCLGECEYMPRISAEQSSLKRDARGCWQLPERSAWLVQIELRMLNADFSRMLDTKGQLTAFGEALYLCQGRLRLLESGQEPRRRRVRFSHAAAQLMPWSHFADHADGCRVLLLTFRCE